mmetsp:Transcript_28218/g.46156  ORF Transcript_28218/g.46156 Transcript_28218/m.46156 type:complete len:95 (-) Transcript_28218:105-389(-)
MARTPVETSGPVRPGPKLAIQLSRGERTRSGLALLVLLVDALARSTVLHQLLSDAALPMAEAGASASAPARPVGPLAVARIPGVAWGVSARLHL